MCLRAIRNAWHFCYALRLVFKVACVGFGIALLTLTGSEIFWPAIWVFSIPKVILNLLI
ncbi:DUF3265 domain-containing protein [Vibrio sp. F13]|nr:DUF3265 domain-containing protein [Vibrio sp. F13]